MNTTYGKQTPGSYPPRPGETEMYKEFEATELYCPNCRQPMPVRKRLLLVLPEGDKYTRTREYFLATMTAMMGGRAAEELIFSKITNGAASDIQNATNLARKMVCEWGMSEKLGPLQFGKKQDLIFHRRLSLPLHPNGMRITAFDGAGEQLLRRKYYSIGGGFIKCKDEEHCNYRISFGYSSYLCTCPVRHEIYRKYNY